MDFPWARYSVLQTAELMVEYSVSQMDRSKADPSADYLVEMRAVKKAIYLAHLTAATTEPASAYQMAMQLGDN